jgi:acyl transferase domain-containing protein/phosphopantetheinyl transferase
MACIFPGAGDLKTYWKNIQGGVDAIRPVPEGRWDSVFYDPEAAAAGRVDRIYCNRGGFIDDFAQFDAAAWGVMPVAARASEPDQLLLLEVAARTLADAGYGDGAHPERSRPLPRRDTSVILGRGGYLNAGMARLVQKVRVAEEVTDCLRRVIPGISEEQVEAVRAEYQSKVGHIGPDTVIGLVPNLAASRIANRLDLQGPSYTVDGACASSLIAVDRACADLRSGRSDAVLAGGVHMTHDVTFWSVFCQLGALSHSGQIRPFDAGADGLLIGEGVGLVLLKRRADAERDGDRIHALVRGSGVSSDGREASLMNPRVEGQLLALERAWEDLGLDPTAPGTLGLIEAHGTGTNAGDGAELETMARFFGGPDDDRQSSPVIGSVKSMIGHAMPAAGIAGFIKAVLAVRDGVLPPTLHCTTPHDGLSATRFRTLAAAEPWESNGQPRRAGVNAFGFGGINAHIVLEQHTATTPATTTSSTTPDHATSGTATSGTATSGKATSGKATSSTATQDDTRAAALLLARADSAALLAALDEALAGGTPRRGSGPARLAVLDPTPERLTKLRRTVERGRPFHGRKGMSFTPDGLISRGGKLAFLYPGVDAQFQPRLGQLPELFGVELHPELAGDRALDFARSSSTTDLEKTGVAIVLLNRFFTDVLANLGLRPDIVAGHSIGEWSAMIAAGVLPADAVEEVISQLRPGMLEVPGVVFAAIGCSIEKAAEEVGTIKVPGNQATSDTAASDTTETGPHGTHELAVSHDNCPHQFILCGPEEAVDEALTRLATARIMCQKLPFRSGFHSPHFAEFVEPIAELTAAMPMESPRLPLYSATTCAPFPASAADQDGTNPIRQLFLEHLTRPVRFRELLETLHDDGARVFLQVGTGSLVGFAGDALGTREHLALHTNHPRHPGLDQLRLMACALWTEGAEIDLSRLVTDGPGAPADSDADTAPGQRSGPPPIKLELGAPIVHLDTPLELAPGSGPTPDAARAALRDSGDPVLSEFASLLDRVDATQREVLNAWRAGTPGTADPTRLTKTRRISIETDPTLKDHSFFPQPDDWPDPIDRFPLVPMTMSVSMMLDAGRELAAGLPGELKVIGIERVRAWRWMALEEPIEITISAKLEEEVKADGLRRAAVSIDEFIEGTVLLADEWPDAELRPPGEDSERGPLDSSPVPMDPTEMYRERWMFHGPAYQAVTGLHRMGPGGLTGSITRTVGEGSLLDGAGQLFGLWISISMETDRMALPVRLDRATFFGPEPTVGEELDVRIVMRTVEERPVEGDIEITRNGRLWARLAGWQDRRFESDTAQWPVIRHPESNTLTEPWPQLPQTAFMPVGYRATATRDYFARRYLDGPNLAAYREMNPKRQIEWLSGRIAAIDAARRYLWQQGFGDIYPIELLVVSEESGRPRLDLSRLPHAAGVEQAPDLRLSIAHKNGSAVALVAEGREVGIDLEQIVERDSSFEGIAFRDEELALLPSGPEEAEARAAELARLWCAKEAVAKLLGTGLGGSPKDFTIERLEEGRVFVRAPGADNLFTVQTSRYGDWVLAHTIAEHETD